MPLTANMNERTANEREYENQIDFKTKTITNNSHFESDTYIQKGARAKQFVRIFVVVCSNIAIMNLVG